ncbi:MAG: serine/threonine protein kinase [Gemmatimonadota bacterium]|nr:MAG: serine/threonine protein kinase [Gemmatimonadota bacterium]
MRSTNEIPEALSAALPKRYELDRIVGRGGMATVYLAHDVRHDRQVAVKVLHPELTASIAGGRFLNEIGLSAQLTHPHVLMLIDSGDANGFLYYVMPYVGDSLRALLERKGSLPPQQALELTYEVADALSYSHRRGIVHRDIKPENILLSDGHAVVADFGVAKAISTAGGDRFTRTGYPVGTLGYMSPEQAAGRSDLNEATDIYSLACVAFEMLIGEPPGMWITEEAGRLGRFVDAPPKQRLKLDGLPGSLESTLVHAMRLRPDERYVTAGEFAEALKASLSTPKLYDEAEAQRIVQRAAELEAKQSRHEEAAMSLAGVERMAAEIGIAPELVREAARPDVIVAPPPAGPQSGIEKGGLFGYTGKVNLERTIDVEVSPETYGILLEEVRDDIDHSGQINETLSQFLSWESRLGLFKKKGQVKVHISPRKGKTRIKITKFPSIGRRILTTSVITTGVLIGISILVAGAENDAVGLGLLFGLGTLGAVYGTTRAWFRARMRQKERALTRLLDRLATIVRDYDAPALPGPPPSSTGRGRDS